MEQPKLANRGLAVRADSAPATTQPITFVHNHDIMGRNGSHQTFWAKDIYEKGVGWVIIARLRSGGRLVETGVFCVDVQCLGVKQAVYDTWPSREIYQSHVVAHYFSKFPMEETEPSCARRFVEESVEYARRHGFAPGGEYKNAKRVFGGIKASDCQCEFVFGKNGKPFYVQGPQDSPAKVLRVLRTLRRTCGDDRFDFVLYAGNSLLEQIRAEGFPIRQRASLDQENHQAPPE